MTLSNDTARDVGISFGLSRPGLKLLTASAPGSDADPETLEHLRSKVPPAEMEHVKLAIEKLFEMTPTQTKKTNEDRV